MRYNERIWLERELLSATLRCQSRERANEVFYEVQNGLDVNYFSGIRIKVADFINKRIGKGDPFDAIYAMIMARAQEDKPLYDELCQILSVCGVFRASSFNSIKRELFTIISTQEMAKGRQ